jgi:hypothetical protein
VPDWTLAAIGGEETCLEPFQLDVLEPEVVAQRSGLDFRLRSCSLVATAIAGTDVFIGRLYDNVRPSHRAPMTEEW